MGGLDKIPRLWPCKLSSLDAIPLKGNATHSDHFRLVPEVVYELLDLLKKTPEAFQCFRSNLSSTVTITLADEQADFFYCDFSDRSMQLNEGLFALNGR